jgi:hypothetical protein
MAFRLKLDQASISSRGWAWESETMPGPRNGADSVVLPSGDVLLVNGAASGLLSGGYGGGSDAGSPVYDAWYVCVAGYPHVTCIM